MRRRICSALQVGPDRPEEYRRRHAAGWPDTRVARGRAVGRDYSLFLWDDGRTGRDLHVPTDIRDLEEQLGEQR